MLYPVDILLVLSITFPHFSFSVVTIFNLHNKNSIQNINSQVYHCLFLQNRFVRFVIFENVIDTQPYIIRTGIEKTAE